MISLPIQRSQDYFETRRNQTKFFVKLDDHLLKDIGLLSWHGHIRPIRGKTKNIEKTVIGKSQNSAGRATEATIIPIVNHRMALKWR